MVFYSRDNPERDSPIAADVFGCILRLGLTFAIDARAVVTWDIHKCWRDFCDALMREEEDRLRQNRTEQLFTELKLHKYKPLPGLCWEDLKASNKASMSNNDQSAVMTMKLPIRSQAGIVERGIEIEVRFSNSEDHWRVTQIAFTNFTVPWEWN